MKVKYLLLASTLTWGSSLAQVETKTDPEKGVQEIIESHRQLKAEFMKKLRTLPKEDQRAFYNSDYPKAEKTTSALQALIDADPKSLSSLEALTWISATTRGAGLTEKNYATLTENFLNHQEIGKLVTSLASTKTDEALAFLATVSEKSESKDIRGMALYANAVSIERKRSKAAEYDALVAKIIADHPDLEIRGRKIASSLKVKQEAAAKFAIGNQAPEIIGKDADGNEMKLSDYKGKVVVLDFWGDW